MSRISVNVKWLAGIATVISVFTLFNVNASLALAGLWLPVLFGVLLWREGEVPVLLFIFMLQWLEVFTGVFYSIVRGIPMTAMFGGPELNTAIGLSAAALAVAAVGARLGLVGARVYPSKQFLYEARELSVRSLWWAFAGSLVFANIAFQLSSVSAQIRQIALALSGVEYVAFFLLAYVVLARREGYRFLAVAVVIEVGAGIGGFFADFKQPLLIIFIAAVGVMVRVTFARAMLAAGIVTLAILMGVVWSSIKMDYRDYVSGYTGAQIVVQPWDDRIEYLLDKIFELDSYDLTEGVEKLASRVSYVEFFGYTLRYVPNYMPHEDGRLLGRAIQHIVMPRLLFPDKPALESATAKTARYTGILFHSAQHTSISLGYVAEAYVDFGKVGMFFPIFALGVIWGLIYRFFMWRLPSIFGVAFAITVLLNTAQFGLGFNKILGGTLMSFGVMALVVIYLLPKVRPRLYQGHVGGETAEG